MVLEISINGGAYQDIVAAGGSFVTGGYTGTISVNFGSPIGGRMAWTGNSAGYITSTVNLPAAANGQNIRLKWRMATDSSVAGVGVRVDTITGIPCGGGGTPTPTGTATATPTPTATATATPTCTPAAWQAGPAQTPARALFQGALGSDNKFYVAGGQNLSGSTVNTEVARYNATTNTWETVAPLPVGTGQVTVGAANGKVYVAGGFILGPPAGVTNVLRIYDIATNTWTTGASMPAAKEAAAGAVVNGKFYVMGGDDFSVGVNTNYIYDIATNTWSTGAPLPDARLNTVATAVGGMVYVFGGGTLSGTTTTAVDTLLRYDPVANSWTNLGSAGTGGRGNYGGVSPYGTGQLLITGGSTGAFVPGNTSHIFTIGSGTFAPGPALLANRSGHAQGTLPDGRVIVADGFNTSTTTVSTVELLGGPCGPTPTPTATPTATATGTATATPTGTPTGTASPTPTCTPGANVVVDGTFEAGTPWPAWTVQTSTNFTTPLCNVALCGTGGGAAAPFAGTNWAWFGGIGATETATAGQSVVIPAGGAATMTFQMRIGTVSAPFADVLNVRVDGAIVQTYTEPAVAEAAYSLRTINLNAFANGASHTILFEYIHAGTDLSNFTVDDISITGGACGTPTPTPTGTPMTPTPTNTPTATPTPGAGCDENFDSVTAPASSDWMDKYCIWIGSTVGDVNDDT